MAIAPFLKPLVEVRHQLKENRDVGLGTVQLQQSVLHGFVGLRRTGHVLLPKRRRNLHAAMREKVVEVIDQARFVQAPQELGVVLALGGLILQSRRPLVSQQKFELTELSGLKPRGGVQPVAKTRKRHRRHRFEDVELPDERLHNRSRSFERVDRAVQIVVRKITLDLVHLVQQNLEPQFVDLMNDDEQ